MSTRRYDRRGNPTAAAALACCAALALLAGCGGSSDGASPSGASTEPSSQATIRTGTVSEFCADLAKGRSKAVDAQGNSLISLSDPADLAAFRDLFRSVRYPEQFVDQAEAFDASMTTMLDELKGLDLDSNAAQDVIDQVSEQPAFVDAYDGYKAIGDYANANCEAAAATDGP